MQKFRDPKRIGRVNSTPTIPALIAQLLGCPNPKQVALQNPELISYFLGNPNPKPIAPKNMDSTAYLLGAASPKRMVPKPFGLPLGSRRAYVVPHFRTFLSNLKLTQNERADALIKADNIGRRLHAKYYSGPYEPKNRIIVGSYGKNTAIRPPTDIDILYVLPISEYYKIKTLSGNVQSQLLQEIKKVLGQRFSQTDLNADGQVVKAPFYSYPAEVVPAFRYRDNTFITCHTANGGSWRLSNPIAEYKAIADLDAKYANKATHLIRMLKAWKRACNVPLKSIILEIAACSFLTQWPNSKQPILWYDWMVRDFFAYLWRFRNGEAHIPGINESIDLGDQWASKCETAYLRAVKACRYEYLNFRIPAEDEWKKIFGDQFSRAN